MDNLERHFRNEMEERPWAFGVTIDDVRARDLDDAVWVTKRGTGYRLTVCVSDVAALIQPGDPDDRAAALKVTSFYPKDGPRDAMLPPQIAANMASLQPGKPKFVLAHVIDYDASGSAATWDVFRAKLRSSAKLSHETFEDLLNDPQCEPSLREALVHSVALASLLWKRRADRTGMPHWQSAFDPNGAIAEGTPRGQLAKSVVHEFMVAANICATETVASRGLPMVYRNQGARGGGSGGRYEAASHGNVALGGVSYGQFTFPIRSFVNIVNQRVLCAAIQGDEKPYDIGQITMICAEANRAEQRAEEADRIVEAQATGRHPFCIATATRLDHVAFRNLLERPGAFDGEASHDLQKRIKEGGLTHSDVAWLVFSPSSAISDGIKANLLARLSRSPRDIGRVWHCANEEIGLPPYDFEMRVMDGAWIAAAEALGRVGDARHSDPQRVRALAVARLGAEIVGVTLPRDDGDGPDMPLADSLAKAALVDLCRLADWDLPAFTAVDESGAWSERHTVTAMVMTDAGAWRSPSAHACSRKAAEMIVSNLAISALAPYAREVFRTRANDTGIDMSVLDNDDADVRPLRALNDFCRLYGIDQQIVWTSERPSVGSFECAAEIKWNGLFLRETGRANTRMGAMEEASVGIANHLLGRARKIESSRTTSTESESAYRDRERQPAMNLG